MNQRTNDQQLYRLYEYCSLYIVLVRHYIATVT